MRDESCSVFLVRVALFTATTLFPFVLLRMQRTLPFLPSDDENHCPTPSSWSRLQKRGIINHTNGAACHRSNTTTFNSDGASSRTTTEGVRLPKSLEVSRL